MSNLDIFNLDAEAFVTPTAKQGGGKDLEFYKPYPEDGKVYRWDENTLNWVQIEDALPMEMQSVLPS